MSYTTIFGVFLVFIYLLFICEKIESEITQYISVSQNCFVFFVLELFFLSLHMHKNWIYSLFTKNHRMYVQKYYDCNSSHYLKENCLEKKFY